MKKTLTIVLLWVLWTTRLFAQGWQPLGPDDMNQLSFGAGFYAAMALDTDKTVYVAFRDGWESNKLTVKRFDSMQNKWIAVGTPGFTSGVAAYISLVIDHSNTPVVAFQDGANSSKLSVKKFDGTNWIDVGTSAISNGNAQYIDMEVSPSGDLYVAYKDAGLSGKLNVKKFDGSAWSNVGPLGITSAAADYSSLVFNNIGQPVVAFRDYLNNGKISVLLYDGVNWTNVGSPGFSPGGASYTDLAVSANNTYYVTYQDQFNSSRASVKKFDGANWVDVGNPGISLQTSLYNKVVMDHDTVYLTCHDNGYNNVTIRKFADTGWVVVADALVPYAISADVHVPVFTADGELYIAFKDASNNVNKMMVKKYDGNAWKMLGNESITDGASAQMSHAIHPNGSIYACYQDPSAQNKISVKTFDGTGWIFVGNPGISQGLATFPSIAVSSTNQPYIVYKDNTDSASRVSVKKFDGTAWVNISSGSALPSDSAAGSPSITFGQGDTLFVLFQDIAYQSKATVMRFDGSNWAVVGSKGFSAGACISGTIKTDNSNQLYVCYHDGSNGNKMIVKKFDGTGWADVGTGFITSSPTLAHSLYIDQNNVPCVAYKDPASGNKITVIRYDINTDSWLTIGNAGFSTGTINSCISLTQYNGVFYVMYSDVSLSSRAVVKAFDGTSWIDIGTPGFSAGATANLSTFTLGLGVSNNMLTAIYQSGSMFAKQYAIAPLSLQGIDFYASLTRNKQTLLEWRAQQPEDISSYDITRSTDGVVFNELAKVKNTGVATQQYQDTDPAAGNNHYRLKIHYGNGAIRFSPVRSVYNPAAADWDIFPVPANNTLTLVVKDTQKLPCLVSLFDGYGHLISEKEITETSTTISVADLAPGNYYLRMGNAGTKVFVKQ